MKKLFTYTTLLALLLVGATNSLAKIKPLPRYKKVVLVKPVRPQVMVFKPVNLKIGFVWIEGHYKWNKRTHGYIWVNGRAVKKRNGKLWVSGHWKLVRGGWAYVPGFWA